MCHTSVTENQCWDIMYKCFPCWVMHVMNEEQPNRSHLLYSVGVGMTMYKCFCTKWISYKLTFYCLLLFLP